ncbi:MAG TPA: hypothetical protein DDW94_05660 [Deltaproteobacteria bacterium]|nr:MAG: hypothetical protein A2Z79_04285 [Deltaproteobacteria bacterium GWA2_55_82]OGQ64144.1 MAG: hypothetical protein A3I81_10670 [Deltaproteobacteria bacterium RIFCSPLOWO2_02_FULL_55_12]OIJ74596.1 MAG: hypothetical protein A2V21_310195 [Deltaproteobacteria bacterium GWC2_55_46]HBG46461.1 hypothetical protein [Deltaproteobacteria bacterium]HCY10673.1 hypothetical protein [Deltaproteobacteria bacterium]
MYILTASLFLFVVFLSMFKVSDYDVWFHLKTGEQVLKTLSIPGYDTFSHTAPGHPWIAQEWLFGVLIYLFYWAGGYAALTIYKVLFTFLTSAVIYAHLLKRKVDVYIAFHAVLLVAIFMSWRLLERPEMIFYLFISIYILLLEDFRLGTRKRALWALPAIMLFWVNIQYTALIGLVATGAYLADTLFGAVFESDQARRAQRLKDFRFLLLIFAFVAATLLLNPNTYQSYTFPFTITKEIKMFAINEFNPPNWGAHSLFFISFGASAAIILLNAKRASAAHLLIFAALSYAAFKHMRNITLWAVATVPFMAIYLNALKERAALSRAGQSLGGVLKAPLLLWLSLAVILSVSYYKIGFLMKSGWWGAGVSDRLFPVKAIRFMEENGIKGNMYNTYSLGGYMIWSAWPESRVFIDGRADLYGEVRIKKILTEERFEDFLDAFAFDFAVVAYSDSDKERFLEPEAVARMALVYWDDAAMLFVRRTPETAALIEKYEYRSIKPADASYRMTELSRALLIELQRNIMDDPKGWRNHKMLADVYTAIGEAGKAKEASDMAKRNSGM